MKVTILGAGTWGIALAEVLAINNLDVSVWHYKSNDIDQLRDVGFKDRAILDINQKLTVNLDTKDTSMLVVMQVKLIQQNLLSVIIDKSV